MIKPILQPQKPPTRTVLSVAELNRECKNTLEYQIGSVWVQGEISNYIRAASGHWYFTLKDDRAQVRCAMFKFKSQSVTFSPRNGDRVIIKAKVSLYEPRGDYQLLADYMEPAGLGDLQQELNRLLEKLASEGLFSAERKQPLPFLPNRIGVVTSAQGAAIHDVLNGLKRRCPMVEVIIYPTLVQGKTATESILRTLDLIESRDEVDVVLLTRGGGSLEDLWCFNDERLAHKLSQYSLPTIAAIGHEVDTTIVELVADVRASTPSAAAELLVPDSLTLSQKIDYYWQVLISTQSQLSQMLSTRLEIASLKLNDPTHILQSYHSRIHHLSNRLMRMAKNFGKQESTKLAALNDKIEFLHPKKQLDSSKEQLTQLEKKLINNIKQILIAAETAHQTKVRMLNTLSPLSTLSRGYAIARQRTDDKVITSASEVRSGDKLEVLLAKGEINVTVD